MDEIQILASQQLGPKFPTQRILCLTLMLAVALMLWLVDPLEPTVCAAMMFSFVVGAYGVG